MQSNRFKLVYTICGIAAYLFWVLMMYSFAVMRDSQSYILRHSYFIFLLLSLASYGVFLIATFKENEPNTSCINLRSQVISFSFVMVVIMIPLIVRFPGFLFGHYYFYAMATLGFFISFAGIVVYDLASPHSVIKEGAQRINPSETIGIIVLLCILLVLSYEKHTYYLWDSSFLFRDMCEYTITDIFDLQKLDFWDHISYGFMAGGIICKSLFGDTVSGMNLYGRVLMLIGAYGFYKLFRFMYKDTSTYLVLGLTCVYCLGPYYLGMCGYNYNDSAAWYITPILTYELFAGKWVNAFLIANYYVFTKEPCVVSYTFLVMGIYIVEAIREKKMFHHILRYTVLALPCVMFLLASKLLSSYKEAELIFSIDYALDKLKSFILVDFNWLILVLGCIALIVMMAVRAHRRYLRYAFPVLLSAIAFMIVSCIFNTDVNHVRYIDGLISQVYILGSFFFVIIIRGSWTRRITMTVSGALMLISAFLTIDPVMRLVYPTVDAGDVSIVNTTVCPADGIAYNRQYNNHGYLIDMALEDIAIDSDNVIYMPAGNEPRSNPFYFDSTGIWEIIDPGQEMILEEYWNPTCSSRMTDLYDPDNIPFDVHVIRVDTPISIRTDNTGYYLYTDYCGSEIADIIRSEKKVVDECVYEKRGWALYRLEFVEGS